MGAGPDGAWVCAIQAPDPAGRTGARDWRENGGIAQFQLPRDSSGHLRARTSVGGEGSAVRPAGRTVPPAASLMGWGLDQGTKRGGASQGTSRSLMMCKPHYEIQFAERKSSPGCFHL
ncbi:MAG: hypothetical protein AN484_24495 [Aphanizomenon flos-aquae WA102]|uniref:Uncharacterized protein n=1 Tax=Aphanizomenon flos-aquae WA102 TaxID=1710896 RepID=A0A1B7WM06_APHFL|nr:MAG: hypothetical protein AN484_24495 [Aphanizomenon flos-aquae WA102]